MDLLGKFMASELGRVTLSDYWRFFLDLVTGRRTTTELNIAEQRFKDCASYLPERTPLRVLDLANGSLRPQSEILAGQGHRVVGLDLVNIPSLSVKSILYGFARVLFRLWLPSSPKSQRTSFVYGTVAQLPFASNTFDLVTSVAAFEHFLDIPRTVSEAYRVLRPGGVIWVGIHPFTALSGGHNVGLRLGPVTKLPTGVEPWDHLRKRTILFSVPLNEWTVGQYKEEFQKYFKLLSAYHVGPEGGDLLTPEIRAELKRYSLEELTHSGFIICSQKR